MTARDANDVLQEHGEDELRRRFDQFAGKRTLTDVHGIFRQWLGAEYDMDTLNATLACAAAERLKGDPLWLLIVSGPGNAKTETVQALSEVECISDQHDHVRGCAAVGLLEKGQSQKCNRRPAAQNW